jgi:hypothetical protein
MAWQHILYKHVVMTAGRLKDCNLNINNQQGTMYAP